MAQDKTFDFQLSQEEARIITDGLKSLAASLKRSVNAASTPVVRQAYQSEFVKVNDLQRKFPS